MQKTLSLVALVLTLALGAGWFVKQDRTAPATAATFGFAAEAQEAADPAVVQEMSLGDPAAPVTVIEYASFTCPHCANFHANVLDDLKADYIDTGKVHFIYREVYFDRFGLWAGMLARCGGPEKYFGIADMIYDAQSDWTQGADASVVAGNLRRIGLMAGLEQDQIDACLNDAATAQALVTAYQQNAEADGINSTPTFIIDGQKYSNMPYDEFARVLDEKLAD